MKRVKLTRIAQRSRVRVRAVDTRERVEAVNTRSVDTVAADTVVAGVDVCAK